jgi:N-formylglutamate amidohydrolase
LKHLLDAKRQRFGFAILLCGHSMPSRGRAGHADPGQERADVVPGTRGRTTAAAPVIDVVDATARAFGFSVAHDAPYRGGFSTGHYGQPSARQFAIQIELARRLYMDERTLARKSTGFEATRRFCQTVVAELGRLSLSR